MVRVLGQINTEFPVGGQISSCFVSMLAMKICFLKHPDQTAAVWMLIKIQKSRQNVKCVKCQKAVFLKCTLHFFFFKSNCWSFPDQAAIFDGLWVRMCCLQIASKNMLLCHVLAITCSSVRCEQLQAFIPLNWKLNVQREMTSLTCTDRTCVYVCIK